MLIGTVGLLSFPQCSEQRVITVFPPTPHVEELNKETEIAQRNSENTANYLR
jgi:hypothetical protein